MRSLRCGVTRNPFLCSIRARPWMRLRRKSFDCCRSKSSDQSRAVTPGNGCGFMPDNLKRLLIERMLIDDTVYDMRMNPVDRRNLKTYMEKDRRSGAPDRRAKTSEIVKRFLLGYSSERRKANSDRRKQNTYIRNDRRSGIADRRSGSWFCLAAGGANQPGNR